MQPSIAIVNDLSGFGRCSLTVSLPIISAMGISCGVVPTAILSNQTEYPEYSLLDFTPYMEDYLNKWKILDFAFDGLYTGFLGSEKQIAIIKKMIEDFSFSKIIVDPVMGDHGIIYDSYTEELCDGMRELVNHSTIATPNLTELCILTKRKYHKDITENEVKDMCMELAAYGAGDIVVTGLENGSMLGNAIYLKENDTLEIIYDKKILPLRPGTGDVFASIIAGGSIKEMSLSESVHKAMHFICTCLERSSEHNIPINDGVCFEEYLYLLHQN
ncbi:MAG: pyridoxamine kinase [Lachnospiraceae bacterium]|nr:pyridoxamine kinase [Lachnospiraceae bacterium]